ncbi:MAG: hypothetical protein J7K68_01545 [Candidatus Diapherotrites archaeon]|nr:hypothetical protein [Candidatus Diapherotrites archaeon]
MVEFTKEQARIAKALVPGPKTIEELRRELEIPMNKLTEELAQLMKLKLVSQKGFPTKYYIIDEVRRGVMEEEKTNRPFKAHFIIEGISKNKEALKNAQKALIERMKKDKLLRVQNIEESDIAEDNGNYSTFFEADISTKTFEDMVYAVLTYGPSSVELFEPEEFTLKRQEMQGALMDIATILHSYMGIIAQLKMKLDEEQIIIKDKEGKK